MVCFEFNAAKSVSAVCFTFKTFLSACRSVNVQQRSDDVFVHPCVLPQTTPEQLIRLRNRASRHINFYMQHTPDYFIGMGLMCICKLDLLTLLEAAMNVFLGREVA